ncbi:MAG: ribonuclease H [Acidimicrobiales bacterium]
MNGATAVYTDGACSGNPGPGGWAWAVPDGRWRRGFAAATTNQRLELAAVLDACEQLEGRLVIVSDSTYVVNCWRDKWYVGWMAKGWKNSQRQPVANRDLWEPLVVHFQSGRLILQWVKGHSGDPMNDLVDRLAVRACVEQRGAAGERPPTVEAAGPADLVAEKVDTLAGHPILVAGLRPAALGGYEPNPQADRVRDLLRARLLAEKLLHPDVVVLSGMDLGAPLLGVEAAASLDLPYVAVLPYPSMESVWRPEAQEHHRSLLGGAREVVTVGRQAPTTKQQAGMALGRRNDWIARHATDAVVVWDGHEEATAKQLKALESRLGPDHVQLLEP